MIMYFIINDITYDKYYNYSKINFYKIKKNVYVYSVYLGI